jgi:hypothetical protein
MLSWNFSPLEFSLPTFLILNPHPPKKATSLTFRLGRKAKDLSTLHFGEVGWNPD